MEVELHGFASGSPWTTVEAGLENLRADVRPVANRYSRAAGTFKVKGILTRSVALTITDPGACSTSNVSRVAHTTVTLK